jgi:hypothetical protein
MSTLRPVASASRRQFLRGLGTMLSLPVLESLSPRGFAAPAAAASRPVRMAFLYTPNGVNVDEWFPTGEGHGYTLNKSMQELEAQRGDFSIITGLAQDKAWSNGDGGGDHARANATFLTGCQARKTAGADIRLGVSVDQIAAQSIGHLTKLPSLELSTDGQRSAGRCDSGYSCAYQFNLAWANETTPVPPEMDPRLVFERMFGSADAGGASAKRRQALRMSILDTVLADANSIAKKANAADRAKLDEYLTSVRDIEQRVQRAEKLSVKVPAGVKAPTGIPDSFEAHIRMMFDLLALAFQTDVTRISTFQLSHDGSNRSFAHIGVPDSHHQISHHSRDPEKLRKIAAIDRFYISQLSYFLKKLKSIQEGEGNLLDQSMIVYGSGIRDGDRHSHNELPVILAGKGGGSIQTGRHYAVAGEDTPMTNMYLSLLDRIGVPAERIGDSTGRLEGI